MKKVLAIIIIIIMMWITLAFWSVWTNIVLIAQQDIISKQGEMHIIEKLFSLLLSLIPVIIGIWLSKITWQKITYKNATLDEIKQYEGQIK